MPSPQLKDDTTNEGSTLPIPAWTEEPHSGHQPHQSNQASKPTQPLVSDDGLHVVDKAVPEDGLHVVDESATTEAPPPYEHPLGRCVVLPSRAAEWRVKGADHVRLCTLAASVLVREGLLDGANVELLRVQGSQREEEAEKTPQGPIESLSISTFSVVSEIQRGASEASLRTYRKMRAVEQREERRRRRDRQQQQGQEQHSADGAPVDDGALSVLEGASSSDGCRATSLENGGESGVGSAKLNGAEKLDRYAEAVVISGKGFARIMGASLKAPGVYTHGLARGFNNMPRLYGDETVREEAKVVGFTSGLAAAGKGLGYGLYDGITGLFVQPVKGAQKEGAKGFVKGFVKGVGGVVCKPAAGGFGVAGYALVGIQKSIEKSISRRASEEECIAVASVWEGNEEMRNLTDEEKSAIVSAWFASSR